MQTLQSGDAFPKQTVPRLGGGEIVLGQPDQGHDWQMVVIYRGLHCPLCKRYLGQLEELADGFYAAGIDLVVASGDPEEKAQAFKDEVGLSIPMGFGLTVEQMRDLGVYVSSPRSPKETDRPFPEPGLFVVNSEGKLHIVDISNAPFARPDLKSLLAGLEFIRANDYPIRGTYAA